jgi:diguanylate cyclase (GGDEF)-like protein
MASHDGATSEGRRSMWGILVHLFAVPVSADKDLARTARWLQIFLFILSIPLVIGIITMALGIGKPDIRPALLAANTLDLIANLVAWQLMRRGFIKMAAFLALGALFLVVTYLNIVLFQSIRSPDVLVYFIIIPMTGLLISRHSMKLVALLCSLILGVIFYLEFTGRLTPIGYERATVEDFVILLLAIGLNTSLLSAAIRRVEEKAEKLRWTNQELQNSQIQLQDAHAKLEHRVVQRTEELRKINTRLHAEIEERKRAEEQLAHDALHDALTGLPNRILFLDRLAHALELTKQHTEYGCSVLFLDLDSFKVVNDSLGHGVGDQLLVALAQRLLLSVRTTDTVARLGGDEFVILLEGMRNVEDASAVASHIQARLKQPFDLSGHRAVISASIGIVANLIAYDQPGEILRDADIAMYRAKALGKAHHELFSIAMREQAMTRLEMENDLRLALERQEFLLYYQPIVSLGSHQITGFETLLRWRHPRRGFVAPTEFIPIVEETGLIIPLGQQVLAEACRQLREWQIRFPGTAPLTISVNVSAKQIAAADFVKQVVDVLRSSGLDAHCLKLEITEGVYLDRSDEVIAVFQQLAALGIQIDIDDFGTGYSSLAYLHAFPIKTIKIDRGFVGRMGHNRNDMELVRAVIAMAHSLGMKTVAEGIETTEQLNKLLQFGCDYGQGYLFSHPLDESTAERLLLESAPDFEIGPQPVTPLTVRGRLGAQTNGARDSLPTTIRQPASPVESVFSW